MTHKRYFFIQLKMATLYYRKQKERIHKEAHERCQNHSEEEKDKRQKTKARDRYQNLSKEKRRKKASVLS